MVKKTACQMKNKATIIAESGLKIIPSIDIIKALFLPIQKFC
jgi:hypothetical protein